MKKMFLLLVLIFSAAIGVNAQKLNFQQTKSPSAIKQTTKDDACPPATNVETTVSGSNVNITWNAPAAKSREILVSEDFEGYEHGGETPPEGWLIYITENEDEDQWLTYDMNYVNWATAHSGTGVMVSFSWAVFPSDPDTYLITPLVEGASLIKYYIATNPDYPDHYSLMISKTGTDKADFETIFEEIPGTKGSGQGQKFYDNSTKGKNTEWFERMINLPEGTKYVAFRHHDSYDCNYLFLDDVTVYSGITVNNYTYTITKDGVEIATGITGTSYTDSNVDNGTYNYCVKVVHADCTSAPACASATVNVNEDCAPATNVQATANGSNVNITWNAPAAKGREVLISEDFEGYEHVGYAAPGDWFIYITENEDEDQWVTYDLDGIVWASAHSGTGVMASFSFLWGGWDLVFDPDTYLVTPLVEGATQVKYYITCRPSSPDHYSVMISKTGKDIEDFETIFEEIPEIEGNEFTWQERILDLPEGTKYVAFRHYDSAGNGVLFLDDVTVYGGTPVQDYTYTVTKNGVEIATELTETTYTDNNVPAGTHDYCVKVVYADCTSTPACATISGINNEVATNSVRIFPNPAKDVINIEGDVRNITMYNSLGQAVKAGINNGQIDVTSLQNGIYYLTITGSNKSRRVEKIIIAK